MTISKDLFELAKMADGSTFTVSGKLDKGCKRFTTSFDELIYCENDPSIGSFEMSLTDENIIRAFAWLYNDDITVEGENSNRNCKACYSESFDYLTMLTNEIHVL